MAAIVGIDARVDYSINLITPSWVPFSERNQFSINIAVDIAEHKPFVANLSSAWVEKARTWMSWSGSMEGYYDNANDDIFDRMVAGAVILLRFFNSRNAASNYWEGQALVTSVDIGNTTDDFATLNADFEGNGALTKAP